MHYTTDGAYDSAYDVRVDWTTHKLRFRQTIKGVSGNYVTVKKFYYR